MINIGWKYLNVCRSYNASKYSSYYNNSFGKEVKSSAPDTSSSGFHSTNNKLHSGKDPEIITQISDYNNNKHSNVGLNTAEHLNNNRNQTITHHKRHGSDSVCKDLDTAQTNNPEKRTSPSEKRKGKREHRTKGESKGRSLGDVTEPLNAERLRPIRQKTRNAVVSILDDCEVCLEFIAQEHAQDVVVEVLRISSNGMKIVVYHPNGKHGVSLSLEPPAIPSSCEGQYLFSNLPSKYWKKYKYAVNFVNLVRKLTPRVGLHII